MLRVHDVSKWYGARRVLNEVSLAVTPGEKIALVGANGAGKTTLLRIVQGDEHPDEGRVEIPRGWRVGYLPQDAGVADERTL
jgi:ATP-binding cassette subfamily F protein 3